MESRKVQEVGGGTYTVSLPRSWADTQAIEAGSVVDIHTHIDDLLVVQPRGHSDDATLRARVRVDHDETARLEHTLRAAYSAGAEEIRFVAADSFTRDQRRVVNRAASELAGVTLDGGTESHLHVRTLLDAEEVSIWQSVRQLKFVTLSMYREATAALLGERTADSVLHRDDDADRLFAIVDRHFDRSLSRLDEVDALDLTRTELFRARTIARELDRVADHAERIATVTRRLDEPVDESLAADVRPIAESTRTIVEDASQCVIDDGAIETAYEVLAAKDDLLDELDTLQSNLLDAGTISPRLVRAMDSLRRTAETGGNIAELRIRSAVQTGEINDQRLGPSANLETPPDSR
ncbi:PhoU domain-containing protein [Halorientalis litorea]|uniref:PhoU domain-containing protein n=1 Tax=Halorientalis litorea TaxID=2931977 RepID=UPI001FF6D11E|nr:phosphate uptake regulator PhoU [Halorientalis litorea]